MMILSLLHDKINVVRLVTPLFGKREFFVSSVVIPSVEPIDTSINIDNWAIYLKQALLEANITRFSKQKVELILGMRFFEYERFELPAEITGSSVSVFVKNKLEENGYNSGSVYSYREVLLDQRGKRYVNTYILKKNTFNTLKTLLAFYELSVEHIYAEADLVFQLFEHTLNKQKTEPILYCEYNKETSYALVFDSLGMAEKNIYLFPSNDTEKELKKIQTAHEGTIARLILGGSESQNVRQDTFTKSTTIWTNPLHKITAGVSHFEKIAEKYRLEIQKQSREIALLYAIENKTYALMSLPILKSSLVTAVTLPHVPMKLAEKLPVKESPVTPPPGSVSDAPVQAVPQSITPKPAQPSKHHKHMRHPWLFLLLMIASLALSFGVTWGYLHVRLPKISAKLPSLPSINLAQKPSPTPKLNPKPKKETPTPTSTPAIVKEDLVLEVQNGVGTPGLAADAKATLEELGYTVETVGNADSYDYEETVIITQNRDIFDMVKKDLTDYGVAKPTYEKTSDEKTTVIIGSDFTP